jgi:hypothetical protein
MWGPRFLLFLPENDFESLKIQISAAFSSGFPHAYRGYSTNFSAPNPTDNGVRQPIFTHTGQINPLVEYHTIRSFFEDYLGYAPSAEISISQWLTFTEHRLLGVTSGQVFRDDLGLNEVRQKLNYFPHDIWLWMLAAQWTMISEEEAFVGRCGIVGDELGSKLVAARQVQRIMRTSFLMEKRYCPYSKWFGTAFSQLEIAPSLQPVLEQVLQATLWKEREEYLGQAYQLLAEKQNSLGLTDNLDPTLRNYFGRPFQVLFARRFADAIQKTIRNDTLSQLTPVIGSVSQFTDSETLFDNVQLYEKLKNLYH